jgi:hypothetical protein
MRKYLLGAAATLAMAAGAANAQGLPTQSPAPVVPAGPAAPMGSSLLPAQGSTANGTAASAPVIGMSDPLPTVGTPIGTYDGGGGGGSYVEASYLLMFLNGAGIPIPLATGGPSVGVLGRPGTTVLLGNDSLEYDAASGLKLAAGGWYGGTRLGFEASGMYIGEVNSSDVVNATGSVLARPFFDPVVRAENARIISSPGAFNGAMSVDSRARAWSLEATPFWRAQEGERTVLDLLAGFRYFGHEEDLRIADHSRILPGGVAAFNGFGVGSPANLTVEDKYGARTNFYGGNLGARVSYGRGSSMFIDLTGKVAIGGVRQIVQVDGNTTVSRGAFISPTTVQGGFLASGNQLGRRSEGRFAVLPEGDLKIGFQLGSSFNIFAGYQVIYLSSVARPGDQLNRNIALTQLPTAPTYNGRPVSNFVTTIVDDDLWIHGFNFGLTYMY